MNDMEKETNPPQNKNSEEERENSVAAFFEDRAKEAPGRERVLDILSRAGKEEPREGDEL